MDPTNGDEKKKRFQEAFERGRDGHVGSYNVWLENHGFDPSRVDRDKVTEFFRENPTKSVNQDDVTDIAEYAGFVTTRQDLHHIPVIGPSGIGKTQLLHTVIGLLSEVDDDIDTKLLEANRLGKKTEDGFLLDEYSRQIAELTTPIVCIDDCGLDKRIRTSLRELRDAVDAGLFVTTWTPERWGVNQDQVRDVFSPAKEVHLRSFTQSETKGTLRVIYDYISQDNFALPSKTEERIHELSDGIPRLIHLLALESLREAYHKELVPGHISATDAAADRLNLSNASARVQDLSEARLTVLKQILQLPDERGVQPGTLVDELHRDKSTISYHLRELNEIGFVERDRKGRRAFYRVTETIEPLVQRRISQEAEYNA
ncbi:Helix-turn-helix domain-containing protein [Halorubrum vacuolatum]|uniref:Helix-turn-helix domain-containing protein n=2 Tax=Halorubrum vacuolatum TaxID=63740 RepID=A0A238XU20_HALVU|nr:helix-turn-helix domain-containing protein [Halorubrum vacuolatum]SNR61844.1 Helix-turn-helix domain-containing protein [Halorubrum vacuolatum]